MALFTVQAMSGPAGDVIDYSPKEFDSYAALQANLRGGGGYKIANKMKFRVTMNTHGLSTSDCVFSNMELSVDLDYAYKIEGHYDPILDLMSQLKTIAINGKIADFFLDCHFGD